MPKADTSERVSAMRTDRKQELEERLVRGHTFRVLRMSVLPANLAEFAGPIGDDQRRPLIDEVCVIRTIGTIDADAAEPAARKLIIHAGIHAERRNVADVLTATTPHQLGATHEAAVNRAAKRPIPNCRIHPE